MKRICDFIAKWMGVLVLPPKRTEKTGFSE